MTTKEAIQRAKEIAFGEDANSIELHNSWFDEKSGWGTFSYSFSKTSRPGIITFVGKGDSIQLRSHHVRGGRH